jgi:glycopeptide antibiotics resistance protein
MKLSDSSVLLRWFPVAYAVFGTVQATLLPYDFHMPQDFVWPELKFGWRDALQNIMFFVPTGVLLALALGNRIVSVVVFGAGVSLAVELIQLFDVGRHSNVMDVATNALGTFAGYVFWQHFLHARRNPLLALAMMTAALSWIVAFRALEQPVLTWLILGLGVIGLSALTALKIKVAARLMWVTMVIVPLAYLDRQATSPVLLGFQCAGLVVAACWAHRIRISQPTVIAALCTAAALVLAIDAQWYITQPKPISWNFISHMHWIDAVLAAAVIFYSWICLRAARPQISLTKSTA